MAIEQQERDNIIQWRPDDRPFYERYDVKLFFPEQHAALWLAYTVLVPTDRESKLDLRAVYFNKEHCERPIALRREYPLAALKAERDIFYVQIDQCALYNTGLRGSLAGADGELAWEFNFIPNETSFLHFPNRLYYHLSFPKTKVLAPNLLVRVDGEFTVKTASDRRRFDCRGSPAYQAHAWGSECPVREAWTTCTSFCEDDSAVFEALSSTFPTSMFYLKTRDCTIDARGLLHSLGNRHHYDLERWDFEFSDGKWKCVGSIFSKPDWMAGVAIANPLGGLCYSAVTALADMELSIYRKEKGAWQFLKTLTAKDSVAYEVIGPKKPTSVRFF